MLRRHFVLSTAAAAAPVYENRKDLLFYLDPQGRRRVVKTPEDWKIRVAHLRQNMERVMGPLPAASTAPLDMRVLDETPMPGYVRRHVTFVPEAGDRLPGYLSVPANATGGLPSMVCLPGSSKPGKDAPAGLVRDRPNMGYAHELAQRGYVTLALDYPLLHTREYATDPYKMGYASATMKGIVNHRRGFDLLASLPYVNPKAIGVIGHSLGGHNALFLAAFDERVAAVVSSCGFNVFAKHRGGDITAWSRKYYMPRIETEFGNDPARVPFDFTEVLAALAPRPVFVNAPLHDEPDFEVSGVRDCIDAALPVYRDLYRAADRLVVEYPDARHDFPNPVRENAYRFLDRWLKNS